MALTEKQIKLVQDTWAIAKNVDGVTDTFYDRLFTTHPQYKTTLFARTNVKAQAKMLAATIDAAVNGLRKTDELVPVLQTLGMRHCYYGVRPKDYAPVGSALLWTLEYYFKEKFTPEVRDAWAAVYGVIESVMASQCETAEGKKALAAYDAKYGTKCWYCNPMVMAGLALAVAGVAFALTTQ